nr:MAG TPA_asm: hypothetical protein [Caudoviricetes sp.]
MRVSILKWVGAFSGSEKSEHFLCQNLGERR